MSQLIHLRNWTIHVPSVAYARLVPSPFLRRPMILVEGHHFSREYYYRFSEWDRAKKEFYDLQSSIKKCQEVLNEEVDRMPCYKQDKHPNSDSETEEEKQTDRKSRRLG